MDKKIIVTSSQNLDLKSLSEDLNLEVDVLKDSTFNLSFYIKQSCNFNLIINLLEPGANVQVNGSYVLKDDSIVKINTQQNHNAEHTTSTLDVKGVLYDKSYADYRGTIFIAENAPFSDADQQNKNILLSQFCKAISIPSIEVLNNDVKCGHGSAVGYLDQESLYYLRSRGIDQKSAENILIDAFLKL